MQNVHISLPWCACRVCKLSQPVPLGHKQQCRAQMIEAKEKGGSVGERLLLSKLCEFVACKSNSHRVKTLYYLPPVAGTVGGIRVCKRTFLNVFGLIRNSKKLRSLRVADLSTILPPAQQRGKQRLGWSKTHQMQMQEHLKRYPRTTGRHMQCVIVELMTNCCCTPQAVTRSRRRTRVGISRTRRCPSSKFERTTVSVLLVFANAMIDFVLFGKQ